MSPEAKKLAEEIINEFEGEKEEIINRLGKDLTVDQVKEVGDLNQKLRRLSKNFNETMADGSMSESQLKAAKESYEQAWKETIDTRENILGNEEARKENNKDYNTKKLQLNAQKGWGIYQLRTTGNRVLEKAQTFASMSTASKQDYYSKVNIALQEEKKSELAGEELETAARNAYVTEKLGEDLDNDIKFAKGLGKEMGLTLNFQTFETPKKMLEAAIKAKEAIGETLTDGEEKDILAGANGAFIGNTILINKTSAIANGHTSVGSHELLHAIVKSGVNGNDNIANSGGKKLLNYLKESQPDLYAIVSERMKPYEKTENSEEASNYGEEVLNALSDTFKDGKKPNESTLTKISNFLNALTGGKIGSKPGSLTIESLDSMSGSNIYNLIKDYHGATGGKDGKTKTRFLYSNSIDEKKEPSKSSSVPFSKSSKELKVELEDLKENEGNYDPYEFDQEVLKLEGKIKREIEKEKSGVATVAKKEVTEEDTDKEIIKNEKAKPVDEKKLGNEIDSFAGAKDANGKYKMTKEEWDAGGLLKAKEKLIDGKMLDPLIKKELTRNGVTADNVHGISVETFIEDVKDRLLEAALLKFNPEVNNSLGGFILGSQFGLKNKIGDVANRYKKQLSTSSIDVEAGGISSVKELMSEEEADFEFETAGKAKGTTKYKNALESNVFSSEILKTATNKIITIVRTIKNRIDAPVTLNRTVTPLISEIRDEVGKQLDIDLKTMLGGKKDGVFRKELLRTKRYILENMTTTWLMGKDGQGGIPQAIQKQIDGKWVSYPDWVGQKIDREKTTTDQAGRTSGSELVRRLPNAFNNVADEVFLGQFIGPDGNPIRGRKESVSKAMAEEGAFDIINADFNEEGPIFEAFSTNQERLGAEIANNFVVDFARQAERGNVKFLKSNLLNKTTTQLLEKAILDLNSEDVNKIIFSRGDFNDPRQWVEYDKIQSFKKIYDKLITEKISEQIIFNTIKKAVRKEAKDNKQYKPGFVEKAKGIIPVGKVELKNGAIINITEKDKENLSFEYLFKNYELDTQRADVFLATAKEFIAVLPNISNSKTFLMSISGVGYVTTGENNSSDKYTMQNKSPLTDPYKKAWEKMESNLGTNNKRFKEISGDIGADDRIIQINSVQGKVNDINNDTRFKTQSERVKELENWLKTKKYIKNKDVILDFYNSLFLAEQDFLYDAKDKEEYLKRLEFLAIKARLSTYLISGARQLANLTHIEIVNKKPKDGFTANIEHVREPAMENSIRWLSGVINKSEIAPSMNETMSISKPNRLALDRATGTMSRLGTLKILTLRPTLAKNLFDINELNKGNVVTLQDQFQNIPFNAANIIENIDKETAVTKSFTPFSKSPKGISVFDFDDTVGLTKGSVLYTMPDGPKGKLNAEEFAKKGAKFLEEGAVFDFSEFSKVVDGKPGPMVEKMKKMIGKFGPENFFILTARPAEAAGPIHEFLSSIGINIPLENITGLGNSTAQAKADWMTAKAAEGYNDFYFADDAPQNVEAVKKALNIPGVDSKVQQAMIKFSLTSKQDLKWRQGDEDLSTNFKVGDNLYRIALREIGTMEYADDINNALLNIVENNNLDYNKTIGDIDGNAYDVEFSDKKRGTGITGAGNAAEVFGTVLNGVIELANKRNIKAFTFNAKEPSRIKLYNSMTNIIADRLGWDSKAENGTYLLYDKSLIQSTKEKTKTATTDIPNNSSWEDLNKGRIYQKNIKAGNEELKLQITNADVKVDFDWDAELSDENFAELIKENNLDPENFKYAFEPQNTKKFVFINSNKQLENIPINDISSISNAINEFVNGNNIKTITLSSDDISNGNKNINNLFKTIATNVSKDLNFNLYSKKGSFILTEKEATIGSEKGIGSLPKVKDVLNVVDIKSPIQKNRIKFSLSMSDDFNRIIEENKGVESYKVYSDITARRRGLKKNRFDFYVPPSAADFELILYKFMGKGELGEDQKQFFQDALIKPYINGVNLMDSVRQSIKKEYKALLKSFPEVKKDLEKLTPNKDFTYDQAMRVAIWNQYGTEIPGLSQRDVTYLTDLVNSDPELAAFKDGLIVMGRQKDGWLPPGTFWDSDTIISDLYNITEGAGRKKFLGEFIENTENIFGKWEDGRLVGPNINKVEAVYGTNVREALEDSIYRMINGKNRSIGQDKETSAWSSWVNGSTGAIMFMNTRSAALQMLGAVNFLNWRDNNPFNAGKAFLNQPQYWKDFSRIWNSDKLKERRGGLREDVASAEIANAAAGSKNKVVAVTSYLLKVGYTPTQLADSFAIASGGAPFYRNRINSYLKEGLTEQEAEVKAWQDFSKVSDETQQSGDPKDISKQQSSAAGRLLLVFQNFTMQQSRIVKKAALDLKNGRGDAKTNISKIFYYLAVQNIMFSTLQQGLFAVAFDDDDDEDKEKNKKKKTKEDAAIDVANGVLDSILRGTGFIGGITATLKNTVIKYLEEREKKQKAEYAKVVLEVANMSPPIGSKLRKTYSALQQTKYDKDLIAERGWGVMQNGRVHLGPMYSVAGKLVEVGTNFPMDRLVNKVENVSQAFNSENTVMQRIATAAGYSPYTVGIEGTKGDILIKETAKATRKEEGKIKAAETREATKDSIRALRGEARINYLKEKREKRIEARKRKRELLLKKRRRRMGE
jgi:hypothetical protein